jgi:hypothetical protein
MEVRTMKKQNMATQLQKHINRLKMKSNAFYVFEAHLLELIIAGLRKTGKPISNENIYSSVQEIGAFKQSVEAAGADKDLIGCLETIASYHPDYLSKIMAHTPPSLMPARSSE